MTSIRARLLVTLLVLLALAAAAMAAVTYRNVLSESEALFDYQLQQMALSLRDQGEIASAEAGSLADAQLDFVVQIWTVDGRSIYASRAHSSLPARAYLGLATLQVEGRRWRTFGVATNERVIQVAQPIDIRERLAARAAWRGVLPLLGVTPLVALAIWWLSALQLAPLRRFAGDLRARHSESLEPLAAGRLPDELAPLAQALNALLERLRASLATQRAFVADAAHELRSPLTALKLQLSLLQRAESGSERAVAAASLGEGIERATRLVDQLLALARNEPGTASLHETVDLVEVARQALAQTVPFAASRQIEMELSAASPVPIEGDAAALGLLVRNLIDNAVRYSPTGTTVRVGVAATAAPAPFAATLLVDDAGPGIDASERDRVFDRFYRRPGQEEAGSGLGLAIVKQIAAAHSGTVALSSSPDGGLRVRVDLAPLPLSPDTGPPGP